MFMFNLNFMTHIVGLCSEILRLSSLHYKHNPRKLRRTPSISGQLSNSTTPANSRPALYLLDSSNSQLHFLPRNEENMLIDESKSRGDVSLLTFCTILYLLQQTFSIHKSVRNDVIIIHLFTELLSCKSVKCKVNLNLNPTKEMFYILPCR